MSALYTAITNVGEDSFLTQKLHNTELLLPKPTQRLGKKRTTGSDLEHTLTIWYRVEHLFFNVYFSTKEI